MRAVRSLVVTTFIATLIAACGGAGPTKTPAGDGGGAATQAPGGDGATDAPEATSADGGGGGGGVGTQFGKVHLEISGPVQKNADFGFVPAGSLFGGAQGASLSFTNQAGDQVVAILLGADQSIIVSYGGTDFAVAGATCTGSNLNIGTASASGSFSCADAVAIQTTGVQVSGVTMKGTFDAHS